MSGLLDIHVLEGTVSRVSTLTDSIARQAGVVSGRAEQARTALGPGNKRSRNIDEYKRNAQRVLERISQLENRAQAVKEASRKPGVEGVRRTDAEVQKLVSDPFYSQFYRVVADARSARLGALSQVETRLNNAASTLLQPLDGSLYLGSSRPLPEYDPVALAELRSATTELEGLNAGDRADSYLNEAVSRFLSQSLRPVGQGTTSHGLKAFGLLVEDVRTYAVDAMSTAFGASSDRTRRLAQHAGQTAQSELSRVTRSIATDSQRSSMGSTSASTAPAGVSTAKSGPAIPSAPSPKLGSNDSTEWWALFELIDSGRVARFDQAEFTQYKQDGLNRLKSVFGEIDKKVRQGPIGQEPGVAPATIQVMGMLRGLSSQEARGGIDIVLAEVAARGHLPDPPPVWAARGPVPSPAARANPLPLFVADCIEQLYTSLGSRASEIMKDRTKRGVFMLINLSAVDHSFKSEGLNQALGGVGRERLTRLTNLAMKDFLSEWGQLAPYLMDATVTSGGHQPKGKLTGKDREAVKEKFRQFNTEFEVLVEKHRRYKITDPELRQRMAREIRGLIGPLYYRFYDKHRGGDFTKHIEKYIKWDKSQFDGLITSL